MTSDQTAAAIKPAQPRWVRVVKIGLGVVGAVFAAMMVLGGVLQYGKVPACDADRTKDTLSTLNKANQVNAARYNFIRERSRTEDEALCTANLELRAGGSLEYDFRIYKEGQDVKVLITEMRR